MATLRAWIERLGYDVAQEDATTLRIAPPPSSGPPVPPFFAQLAENWLMLSILPLYPVDEQLSAAGLMRLLALNRELCVAKYAQGPDGEIVLCAELPTESLDEPEVADAIVRMTRSARELESRMQSAWITSG